MDTSELISRIIELCHLKRFNIYGERVEHELYMECELPPSVKEDNPFYIKKSSPPLEIHTRDDFTAYEKLMMDTDDMTNFLSRYKNTDYVQLYQKLIKNLIGDIDKKILLEYDDDKDNSQCAAEIIHKVIFKRLKKLVDPVYHEYWQKKAGREKEVLSEMIEILNRYLSKLGIYTLIPKAGDVYDGVILDRFESIPNNGNYIHKIPNVLSVEYPAYMIDFIDENGDLVTYYLQGRCICE